MNLPESALAELLRPVRGRLAAGIACQVMAAALGVAPFLAVAELGRALLEDGDPDDVLAPALVAGAALLLRLLLLLAAATITHFADADLQHRLRGSVTERLGRVPLGWFSDRTSGAVKKAVNDDVAALHHAVAHVLLDLTSSLVTPLICLAYLAWVDPWLSLVTLLPLAIGLYFYGRAMTGFGDQMVRFDEAVARINTATVEFVEGITVVKTFGRTAGSRDRFRRAADDFSDFFLDWVRVSIPTSVTAQILLSPAVTLTVVLTAGVGFIDAGWLTPLDLLPFALLALLITGPVFTLGQTASQLRAARLAAEALRGLLGTEMLTEPTEPALPHGHRVVFDKVSFGYRPDEPVLHGIDLVLEPGTVTALVGTSGAGKSTLAALLPRFFDPSIGRVTLGGADLRRISSAELYQRVGFVLQDVRLLRTSLRDNIRLGRPSADDEAVHAAARAARIHHRILELPRGYDSIYGQDVTLSGGEAQRLSIARALLADTPVLVLDEATAHTDPENEAALQDALSELVAGRTLLVIAHRLASIAGADQIVVLDQGRITERGTHADLLALAGKYAQLWASARPETEGAHR